MSQSLDDEIRLLQQMAKEKSEAILRSKARLDYVHGSTGSRGGSSGGPEAFTASGSDAAEANKGNDSGTNEFRLSDRVIAASSSGAGAGRDTTGAGRDSNGRRLSSSSSPGRLNSPGVAGIDENITGIERDALDNYDDLTKRAKLHSAMDDEDLSVRAKLDADSGDVVKDAASILENVRNCYV